MNDHRDLRRHRGRHRTAAFVVVLFLGSGSVVGTSVVAEADGVSGSDPTMDTTAWSWPDPESPTAPPEPESGVSGGVDPAIALDPVPDQSGGPNTTTESGSEIIDDDVATPSVPCLSTVA